ncbi:hypothetical protein Dimus_034040 [Dionaea muscipula]
MEVDGGLGRFQRLRCSVKHYDWGKVGSDSVVAWLSSANSGEETDPNKPYAEFWMGTHESVKFDGNFMNGDCGHPEGVALKSWIEKNPNVLGSGVLQKSGCDLPFLFKVLSIVKPLSIQAHPDKGLARRLHESLPDVYKDNNHKPEIAVAITEFEALCGFVSIEVLKDVLQSVPEIRELIGDEYVEQFLNPNGHVDEDDKVKVQVKSLFTQLMYAGKDMVSGALSKFKNRLKLKNKITLKEQLVLRLEGQGSILMMLVSLQPSL